MNYLTYWNVFALLGAFKLLRCSLTNQRTRCPSFLRDKDEVYCLFVLAITHAMLSYVYHDQRYFLLLLIFIFWHLMSHNTTHVTMNIPRNEQWKTFSRIQEQFIFYVILCTFSINQLSSVTFLSSHLFFSHNTFSHLFGWCQELPYKKYVFINDRTGLFYTTRNNIRLTDPIVNLIKM